MRNKAAPSSKKRLYTGIPAFLLLILPCIIYWNTIHNDFVFDDMPLIWGSKTLPKLKDTYHIASLFTEAYGYRPIRTLSYALDYQFSGTGPVSYHISNIIYHGITALLVYLVTLSLISQKSIALVAALIFAVHPVHTDSVTYLSGRRDILFTLFYLAGFLSFLKYRRTNRTAYIIIALVSYLLSLGSKEMGVTLPLIFFLYDTIHHYPDTVAVSALPSIKNLLRSIGTTPRKYPYLYSVFLLGAVVFSCYKIFISPASHQEGYYGDSMVITFLTVGKILVHYLKLLLLPVRLIADYSYDAFPLSHSLFEWQTLSSFIALCILLLMLFKMLSRNPWIAFGGAWFFITLLPVCHIIPHHELLAEHYLYLPSYGFCLIFALLLAPLLRERRYATVTLFCFVSIIVLYSLRTIERNRDWKDGMTLWSATVKTVPRCARAQNNLGFYYLGEKKYSDALARLSEAIEIKPSYAEAHNNMGLVFSEQGSYERALSFFIKAFKLNNEYYDSLYNLANTLEKKGHYNSAIWFYELIIKRKPRSPEIHNNLGVVYQKRGQFDLAREHFSKAIIIDPDNLEARNNLGVFYNSQGRYNEAIAEFKQAQRIKPDFAEVYSNLGMVYSGMGQYDSALAEFQKALRIKPNSAETMNNIGNAYKGKGEYDRAIEAFNKTLEINPNLAIPHFNLAIVYLYQKKDHKKSLYHFERVLEIEPGFPKAAGIRKKIEELKKEQQN